MTTERLHVRNVKCGGCAARIRQGLGKLAGVESVDVDVASGLVTVSGQDFSKNALISELASLGYPVESHG